MERFYVVGLDAHSAETEVAVLTPAGQVRERRRVATAVPKLRELVSAVPRPRRVVLEESTIEGGALQRAEAAHRVHVCLRKREVLWRRGRHVERRGQVAALLPNILMITHEHFPEFVDILRAGFLNREGSRLNIVRTGCVEYCYDGSIVERGLGGLGASSSGVKKESRCESNGAISENTAGGQGHVISKGWSGDGERMEVRPPSRISQGLL